MPSLPHLEIVGRLAPAILIDDIGEGPAIPVRTCGCAAVFVRAFARKQAPCAGRTGFAQDSSLEGDGFELPVPREMTTIFEPSCFWFL
jgi:hypothetical protein